MASDDNSKSDHFSASFSLPGSDDNPKEQSNPAAELIRKKVAAAYSDEPDAKEEIIESKEAGAHRSRHQEFIYNLTSSGRPLHEVQQAWHEYYAGLPDAEKHAVWQEFYDAHTRSAQHPAITHDAVLEQPRPKKIHARVANAAKKMPKRRTEYAEPARRHTAAKRNKANPIHSVMFGLAVGSITILIFLFSFFNERIIAPFIQPSRNVTDIPIITSSSVSQDPLVIIPKINVEIPVVYDVNTVNEATVEKALEGGVVHYADTAEPGQDGNVVIVGHSSNNILNPGKYKFAFTLLHKLETGDTFYLQKDGKRYTYQVFKRSIVSPNDLSVLGLTDKPAAATLITCDPPGTSNNRLVVNAEQISPDPTSNAPIASHNSVAQTAAIVPGNSPTLWSRLINWFTN